MKPGIKTSELWITIALMALPVANQLLHTDVTPDQATNVVNALVSLAMAIGGVVAAFRYITGRISLKLSSKK